LRLKSAAILVFLGLVAWFAAAAPQSRKSTKKAAAKTTARKPAKKSPSTAKKSASKTVRSAKGGKSSASATKGKTAPVQRARGQMQPTAQRYREIQQALTERGYLKSEINGKWDAESMEALRRFQQDQNLETSGKIDSLSLIALGLGPRRVAGVQQRPQ
jgi:hypothetical protein